MVAPGSEQHRIVVVLGFHRSGTSMVSRMVNLLGVSLGAEDEMLPPSDRDNARGYWEPRWMNELNEEILATLGGGTFEPFTAAPGWERSPELEPLRERARALLARHFDGQARWGWKDPRTSLTLPFWRGVVGAPISCVVCVRSPADAVASALRRGVTDIHRWHYAERWLDYTTLALAGTTPDERLLVFYEDVLQEPAVEAARLAAFLGVDQLPEQRLEAAIESVDPELRHHITNPWDVAVDPGLPIDARVFYLLLRASRSLEEAPARSTGRLQQALEQVGGELQDARQTRRHADEQHQQTLLELDDVRAAAQEAARLAAAEGERLRADAAEHAETIAVHDARIDELQGAVAGLEDVLTERDAAITTFADSRSWRLTRPLRTAGRLLRKRR